MADLDDIWDEERDLADWSAGPTSKNAPMQRDRCRVCDTPISSCELCEECADDNDPFFVATNCGADLKL